MHDPVHSLFSRHPWLTQQQRAIGWRPSRWEPYSHSVSSHLSAEEASMMIRWHMFLSPADLGLRYGLDELLSLAGSLTPTVEDITLQDRQDAIVWHVLVRPGVPGEGPEWHRWRHGYSYHVASERASLSERTISAPRETPPPDLQQMTLQL